MWPWFPSKAQGDSPAKVERPSPEELRNQKAEENVENLRRAWGKLKQLSPETYAFLGLSSFVIFSVGWVSHRKWDSAVYSRHLKKIRRHYEIPDSWIQEKRFVKGVVTNVPDGDGFSLYHTPGPGWGWLRPLPDIERRGEDVISMRMAVIDAPEVVKKGGGQPFSMESKDWLERQILGKNIRCQLLQREGRYGRIIVIPFLPPKPFPWWRTGDRGINLSEESLRHGCSVVYESPGGKFPHPGGRAWYIKLMEEAQKAKVGMWKNGTSVETPGQYKKRIKQGIETEATDGDVEESESKMSLFQRKIRDVFGRR